MLVNLNIIGKRRASKVMDLTDEGIAIASGLPIKPDQSHLHRFLEIPTTFDADNFIKELAKRQYTIGQIKGDIINCDAHLVPYYGEVDIQKDKDEKIAYPQKSVKFYLAQCQDYRNPIYGFVSYPGVRAVEVGKRFVDVMREIIPDKKMKFIFDKWFSVGELLDYIRKAGQLFITLIKRYENRIKEMENIPVEQFKKLTQKLGITHIPITLRNYEGKVRLVVVENIYSNERVLYGYLTNDEESVEEEIVKEYSSRWGVEFWFEEGKFLGLNQLPSIELNKITTNLAIKLLSYAAISAFRGNVGGKYVPMNAETIYEKFFNKQALIKLDGDEVKIILYGYPKRNEIEGMYYNLNSKLEQKGINPKVPWLNNHTLKFIFK